VSAESATAAQVAPRRVAGGNTDSFLRVLHSEWIKLWSVRSTAWALFGLFIVTVGISALAAWGTASNLDKTVGPVDATNVSLGGILFGQLALAVLGVLIITTEYSTGGIKSSLTAVPQRLRLLAAKAIVFIVVGFVVGLATCFASFYSGMTFFSGTQYHQAITDPHVLRAVVGGALFLVASGLLGFAIGTLLRHTAGAITISVALLFIAPLVLSTIPVDVVRTINEYFLGSAGQQVLTTVKPLGGHVLGPWVGYIVFTVEWAFLLLVGGGLMKRRDA
jgi:ABC-type transport system involved in multi-copper enzyme maturation permease subunit